MTNTKLIRVLCLLGVVTAWQGASCMPSPPASGHACFPGWCALTNAGAVSQRIKPMQGTPLPEWRAEGFLRLPVNFTATTRARVGWDIQMATDLRMVKGVQFDFFCLDHTCFSGFSIYLHSGEGWYTASFMPKKQGGWQRVIIDKSDTRIEGRVAGWKVIDTIRIAGWRCQDTDTECAMANLGPTESKPPDAIVLRSETFASEKGVAVKAITRCAANVSATLRDIGINTMLQSDKDFSTTSLQDAKLVLLPFNPTVPEKTMETLRQFVASGGKIMVFFKLPDGISDLIRVRLRKWVSSGEGRFSGFSRTSQGLATQPEFVAQASGHATLVDAKADSGGRMAAVWRNHIGQNTEYPALTITSAGAFFGHPWRHETRLDNLALFRSVVVELIPDFWRQSAEAALARVGVVHDEVEDFNQFLALFDSAALSVETLQALNQAKAERTQAQKLVDREQWRESIESSMRASIAARRAWLLSRPSRAGEFRGFWCHSAFGVKGRTWEQAIGFLKANGFNAIFPNMLNSGVAFYPSEILTVYKDVSKRGDQLDQCLAACKKHGVQCHVWKTNWRVGREASKKFCESIVSEGRVQKNLNGQIKERWLCPSHPLNQQLEIASMLELVRKYEIDGIHFDYMRYPGSSCCYCDGCRSRFEKKLGHAVSDWPADTNRPGALRDAWLAFRREGINTVVKRVASEARLIRPGVQISAAVFRDGSQDRDTVGQDWLMWCEQGWLDFVCPMNYTDSAESFLNMVAAQRQTVSKARLYPGIGLTCWKDPADAVKLATQIGIVRGFQLPGFMVFDYTSDADIVLPLLRLGVTAKSKGQ